MITFMFRLQFFLSIFSLLQNYASGMVDTTMEDGAVGCGPVKASYDKVVRADVFKADRFMLPRIALSSDFGRQPYCTGALGIWQTTPENLKKAKSVLKRNAKIEKAVRELICINFASAKQTDMKKPIYSIVCAALIIEGAQGEVPKRFQIDEQKQYWEQASSAQVDKFSDSSDVLDSESGQEDTECFICVQGPTDMIFAIDDSQSISGDDGEKNSEWDMELTYVTEVVEKFRQSYDLGTSQGAIIVFSHSVTLDLAYEQSADSLIGFVQTLLRVKGYGTCTADAINAAYNRLPTGRLTDYTVRKIVFILTDGLPLKTAGKDGCQADDDAVGKALAAADKLKTMKEKPTVYAIGNKKEADFEILKKMASEPKHARNYETVADFQSDIKDILFSSCQILVEIPSGSFADMSGSKGGRTITFDLKGMKEGDWRSFIAPFTKKQGFSAFLVFQLKDMVIEVFASFSQPRPTDAAYDAKKKCESGVKKCILRVDDPSDQMDDMCKASFGNQFYVNVHVIECKGGSCPDLTVEEILTPPDYFDSNDEIPSGMMKQYQRKQPSAGLLVLPAILNGIRLMLKVLAFKFLLR